MSRPTLGQLAYRQQMVEHQFHRGTFWKHQASGKVYEITGHSIREDDGAAMIEYRPTVCDGKPERIGFGEAPIGNLRFSRPAFEWNERVAWHDGEMERTGDRFVQVTRSEEWVRV